MVNWAPWADWIIRGNGEDTRTDRVLPAGRTFSARSKAFLDFGWDFSYDWTRVWSFLDNTGLDIVAVLGMRSFKPRVAKGIMQYFRQVRGIEEMLGKVVIC